MPGTFIGAISHHNVSHQNLTKRDGSCHGHPLANPCRSADPIDGRITSLVTFYPSCQYPELCTTVALFQKGSKGRHECLPFFEATLKSHFSSYVLLAERDQFTHWPASQCQALLLRRPTLLNTSSQLVVSKRCKQQR